jgi:toxin ParE1/3/4
MLRWTTPALSDLAHILEYIAERDPSAASDVARAFDLAGQRLEQFPHLGKPGRVPATRELFLAKYPYVLLYRCDGSAVEVLRLLHTRQKRP